MVRNTLRIRLWIGASACAGMAGAHWLAYLLASNSHSHDEGMLAATGHSYWPYFAAIAMAALVAALARPLMQGFRAAPAEDGHPRLASMVAALSLLQMGGFFLLEIGERMLFAPGHSLNVLHESVVLWGLLLQVATALIAALLARVLHRIGEFVARSFCRVFDPGATPVPEFFSQTFVPVASPATGGPCLRAPPRIG